MTKGTPKKSKAITRTGKWQKKFIESLEKIGVVAYACKSANISRHAAYKKRESDEKFADEWNRALDIATDRLEKEAIRRAYRGVDEPVFYQGAVCGAIRKYSDTLLIFLLKANRDKFRQANLPPSMHMENSSITINSYTVVEEFPKPEKFIDAEEFKQPKRQVIEYRNGNGINGNGNGHE